MCWEENARYLPRSGGGTVSSVALRLGHRRGAQERIRFRASVLQNCAMLGLKLAVVCATACMRTYQNTSHTHKHTHKLNHKQSSTRT